MLKRGTRPISWLWGHAPCLTPQSLEPRLQLLVPISAGLRLEQVATHLLRMNIYGLSQLKGREVEDLPSVVGKDTYIFKIDGICDFLNHLGLE